MLTLRMLFSPCGSGNWLDSGELLLSDPFGPEVRETFQDIPLLGTETVKVPLC